MRIWAGASSVERVRRRSLLAFGRVTRRAQLPARVSPNRGRSALVFMATSSLLCTPSMPPAGVIRPHPRGWFFRRVLIENNACAARRAARWTSGVNPAPMSLVAGWMATTPTVAHGLGRQTRGDHIERQCVRGGTRTRRCSNSPTIESCQASVEGIDQDHEVSHGTAATRPYNSRALSRRRKQARCRASSVRSLTAGPGRRRGQRHHPRVARGRCRPRRRVSGDQTEWPVPAPDARRSARTRCTSSGSP